MPDRKGLLVDYGGVLTTPIIASFGAFCADVGLPKDLVKDVFLAAYEGGAESVICQVETGRITLDEFALGMADALSAEAGVPVEADNLIKRLFDQVELDERMVAAVATIRAAGVRTALLSNSWGESGYPRERFPELFDTLVISGEVGLRKPDPPIYHLAAERLGLTPSECVFIDDLEHNVRAAEALGMAGVVHHGDVDATLPQVTDLLGLDHDELFAA